MSSDLKAVFQYHEATKHSFNGYADGPGYLDWATQPNPFRRYAGARVLALDKVAPASEPIYDEAFVHGRIPPAPLNRRSISQFFFDSLAISAWKQAGDARWALRVNPSSGNLHPTEGYLLCGPIEGLCEGALVCHYAPQIHALEVRAELSPELWGQLAADVPEGVFFVGLTSIHWREAWKYGRRAYRYCQHDAGHAIAAVSIAAAGLGWRARLDDSASKDELTALLGTSGYEGAEPEEPDVLIACGPLAERSEAADNRLTAAASGHSPVISTTRELPTPAELTWNGEPNRLSSSHVDWGMAEIAWAARKTHTRVHYGSLPSPPQPWTMASRPLSLCSIIRQRRSAVDMDGETSISRDLFYRMLLKTLPVPGNAPFDCLPWKPHIHLAMFVHRVDDLESGVYFLVRDTEQRAALEKAITRAQEWSRPEGCPGQLELYRLMSGDARQAARQISCGQEIAGDSCFSLGMIAEFEEPLEKYGAWFYPRLFWEAGAVGQVLYLEAEAAGIRSTGIGCYFDDAMHDLMGLKGRSFQDLYHFTVGGPVEDDRLSTLPAYDGEKADG